MSSSETGSVVTRVYDAASRMVSSSDGSTYTFDANGNLTAVDDVKSEFVYDTENRLIFYSSESNPGVETTMVYNAFGQKKRETNPGSDTLFTWDGDDYYGFADAANDPENAVKIFIGDRGTMLGEFNPADSQSRMDYVVDFLGSVTGQTNKKGDLGSERRFKPFGELLSGDSVKPLDFAWTGNTGSMHTGLLYSEQYNRARHYSTTTNIWTTRDPLWPSEHPYGYVSGNPVTRLDPSGLQVVVPSDGLHPDCIDPSKTRGICNEAMILGCKTFCQIAFGQPHNRCYTVKPCSPPSPSEVGACCACNPCPENREGDPYRALLKCWPDLRGRKPRKSNGVPADRCKGTHYKFISNGMYYTITCCYCTDLKTGKVKMNCNCGSKGRWKQK
ncbi:MAG: hypothetical protein J0L72_04215 [Armatimonadetes bacterium]|nr:hypothetical protein [Armatimonadota bacterium]